MPPGVGVARVAVGGRAPGARRRPSRGTTRSRGRRRTSSPSPDSTTTRTVGLGLQLLPGVAQAGEHRAVERVALVGPVQADVGDAPFVDADGHTIAHRAIVACHAHRHEAEPVRRRGADHDARRPQAPRPREAGRSGDRRGGPGDRPAGADRLEPPGLALGRHRGRRPSARPSPPSTSATSSEYRSTPGAEYPRGRQPGRAQRRSCATRPSYLSDNFHKVPDAADPVPVGPARQRVVVRAPASWGSLLPAVWSFMLALRERGMGSAWTTIHLMNDGEREVAEILGIPYDKVTPGRPVPDRLHDRHRLQAGQARAARRTSCTGTSW